MTQRRVQFADDYAPASIGANEADAAFSAPGEVQPASPVGLYAIGIAILVIALLGIAIACLVLAVQMKHEVADMKKDAKESAMLLLGCACSCANITQLMGGP